MSKYTTIPQLKSESFKELSEDELLHAMREEIYVLSARLEDADRALRDRGFDDSANAIRQAEQTLCKAFNVIDDHREEVA